MDPVASVLAAWALFAATHIGMAAHPIRTVLVIRFGTRTFQGLFSVVAAVTFSILSYVYSIHRSSGPTGLALGSSPALRWLLMTVSVVGIVCVVCSLFDYPGSAYALSKAGKKTQPWGFERITRHGFAVGLALVGVAHALLATRLTGTVFFSALALFGLLGSIHQDNKLRTANPVSHQEFLNKSSLLPFVAILTGRNQLVLSELRPVVIGLGLLAAFALRQAHPSIFANGGIYVAGGVIGGAILATLQEARRARRKRSRPRTVTDQA